MGFSFRLQRNDYLLNVRYKLFLPFAKLFNVKAIALVVFNETEDEGLQSFVHLTLLSRNVNVQSQVRIL